MYNNPTHDEKYAKFFQAVYEAKEEDQSSLANENPHAQDKLSEIATREDLSYEQIIEIAKKTSRFQVRQCDEESEVANHIFLQEMKAKLINDPRFYWFLGGFINNVNRKISNQVIKDAIAGKMPPNEYYIHGVIQTMFDTIIEINHVCTPKKEPPK